MFILRISKCLHFLGCGDPGQVTNARRSVPTTFSPGGSVTYTCNAGFIILGTTATTTSTIFCQTNNQWTTRPTCVQRLATIISKRTNSFFSVISGFAMGINNNNNNMSLKIVAINTLAVPVVLYGYGVIGWKLDEVQCFDKMAGKHLCRNLMLAKKLMWIGYISQIKKVADY